MHCIQSNRRRELRKAPRPRKERLWMKGWSYREAGRNIVSLLRAARSVAKIKEGIELSDFAIGGAYAKLDIARIGRVTPPPSFRAGGWSTGILSFKNAVLLLVTLDKGEGDANYEDYFDGSELHWQSQNRHSQSSPLIKRLASGEIEIALFARLRRKVKGATQPFVYCGRLAWSQLEGGNYPVSCRFRMLDRPAHPNAALGSLFAWTPQIPVDKLGGAIARSTIAAAKSMAAVDGEEDARELLLKAVAVRRGQKTFRNKLLKAYEHRCVVTGTAVTDVLEAAHIVPYKGAHTHRVDNGLLLRSDIHTLFDLGLLWVSQQRTVVLAQHLHRGEYGHLHGKELRRPVGAEDLPLLQHLEQHAKLAADLRAGRSPHDGTA